MKTKLITLLMLFLPVIMFSQETKATPTSKADEFSAQAGSLIEKQITDIGSVKNVTIQVMMLKDLISEKSITALRIEAAVATSYGTDSKIASLDADEIDGLVKSIKALQGVFATTRDAYTEVTFKSRTGFEAGAYYETKKAKWTAFLKVERFDSKSMVYFVPDDFNKLLPLIEAAKAKM